MCVRCNRSVRWLGLVFIHSNNMRCSDITVDGYIPPVIPSCACVVEIDKSTRGLMNDYCGVLSFGTYVARGQMTWLNLALHCSSHD